MRHRLFPAATAIAAAAVALVAAPAAHAAPTTGHRATFTAAGCARSTDPHAVTCDLLERTDVPLTRAVPADAAPSGYGPTDLQAAYHLVDRSANINGGLVAIVDPYDDPYAEGDLFQYRQQFGLPACTTANGCFHKVNQDGSSDPTTLPTANPDWFREVSVDLDMVSAICPKCQITLVEAKDILDQNLFAAEDYATSHAKFVSNSWSNPEDPGDAANDPHLDRPGVVITASTGDNTGSQARYPATNPHVVAVGGTSLAKNGTGYSESAWGGAGSGCSAFEPKPAWQPAVAGCANRAEADVSAVADPDTGVAVYDAGWRVFGGTSVAAPIIAATFALATPPRATDYPASYLYGHAGYLNDIRSGGNGGCGAPLCSAGSGWDGPTGLGTPNNVDAFAWYNPLRSVAPDVNATTGTPVSLNLASYATGGVAPYHWFPSLVYLLPPGLTLNQSTGMVTGTPTVAGTYYFSFEVLDASAHGYWVDDSVNWTVSQPMTTVPNVRGLGEGDAITFIRNAGLVPSRGADVPAPQPGQVGTVLIESPGGGTVVPVGSTVSYSIAVTSGCFVSCGGS